MPLADLFSNSLVSPVLQWAKNQNIPEFAGSLLAAYAIPAIAGGLIRKQHRGQVQGMLAQPLIARAFNALQRPQEARDFMTKYQIQEQGLTPIAPTAGATPVQTYNGIPLYTPQTIAQKYPGQFGPRSPYPAAFTSPQFTQPGAEIEPSSLQAIPDVKPLLPSEQMIGGMPANKASLPLILALLQKREEEQAMQQRFTLGNTALDAAVAQNKDLMKVPKIGPKGYMTSELQQRKAGAAGGKPIIEDVSFTDPATGEVITKKQISHDNGKTFSDMVPGAGRPQWDPDRGAGAQKPIFQKKIVNGRQVTMQSDDNGQSWREVPKLEGEAPNDLTKHSKSRDLDSLSKEADALRKDMMPLAPLLKKYPDGNIPTPEILRTEIYDGPFYGMTDSTLVQAAVARLAEIEQQKQQILGGQGGQSAPAGAPAGNFSDFYQKNFGK